MTEIKAGDITRSGTWGEYFAQLEQLTNYFVNGFMDKYAVASLVQFDVSKEALALLDEATREAAKHTGSTGNVHKTNKWQVYLNKVDNYFTATEAQAIEGVRDDLFLTPLGYLRLSEKMFGDFRDRLHHQGVNPISTYGDNGYIPPDVYGSFEGSVSSGGGDTSCMLIEDDGTLVGLRYGTNGIESGLYYFYKNVAEYSLDGKVPIRTNYKYYPPGIPKGLELGLPKPSCENGVLITNINTRGNSNPNRYEYVIALTNGTLDQTKHYAAVMNLFKNPPKYIYASSHGAGLCGFIVKDYVYIVASPLGGQSDANAEFLYATWRVKIEDIKNKTLVEPELVTGWSTVGYSNIKRNTDHIQLADKILSSNPNDHMAWLCNIGPGTPHYNWISLFTRTNRGYLYQHPSKPNVVRYVQNTARYATDRYGKSYGHYYFTIVMEIDVVNKTAKMLTDPTPHKLWRDENTGVTNNFTSSPTNALKSYGVERHDWNNILMTDNGYLFCRTMNNAAEGYPIYSKGLISNFTNRFDVANPNDRNVIAQFRYDDPMVVGSAATNAMSGGLMHEDGYMTFYQNPSDKYGLLPSTDVSAGICRTRLVGSPTGFTYRSINGRVDKGYSPTVDRVRLTSVAPGLERICCDSTPDYKFRSHSLVLGSNKPNGSYRKLNSYMEGEDPVTWSRDEITDVGRKLVEGEIPGVKITAIAGSVAVSTNPKMPCLLSVTAVYPNPDGGYKSILLLAELFEPSSRSGNITNFKVYRTLRRLDQTGRAGHVAVSGGIVADFVTYETRAGDILWAFRHTASAPVPGGSDGFMWYGYVSNATKHVAHDEVKYYSSGYFRRQSLYSPMVIPGVGLAMMDGGISTSYDMCAMPYRVIGDSVADFKSNSKWSTVIIMAAQQVEKGWLVYFTAETPLFMMGSEYMLPPTNIDLRDIKSNPANTTFRLYVRLFNAKAEYYITTEELNPTMALMYIGDIITDATQILTINVDKRIRIDTFQISPTRVGSAIPVTTGVPSQEGTFAWK